MPAKPAAVVAAVDWAGAWIRAALATRDGDLLRTVRRPRPAGIEAQCGLVCDLVAELGGAAGRPVAALGVGIAGITRRRSGWSRRRTSGSFGRSPWPSGCATEAGCAPSW